MILFQVLKPCHFAPNSGCAYDSRKPHTEQRKVPTGMRFSAGAGTPVPKNRLNQLGLLGAPSTQLLTRRLSSPIKSLIHPCTIKPLHLGHRIASALMLNPPENELEELVIR